MSASRTKAGEAAIGEAVRRALTLASAGRIREAIDRLGADRGVLGHPAGCNVLGALHLQAGAAARALPLFDKAIALAPSFADAHSNRGVALQQLGRLDQALAAQDAALRFAPDHLNALLNRGNLLKLLHRPDEAVSAFDRVLAIRPDTTEALVKRAYVQAERRDHVAALADFEAVLRRQPHQVEAVIGKVSALVELRRFEEGLAAIDGMLAVQPANADAIVIRGQILVELDRPAEALALADRLLASGPGGSKAHIVRAAALWRLKRRDEAIAAGKFAVQRYPADVQTHQALSQYCLTVGDFARGWEEYEFRGGTFDEKQAALETMAPRWNGEDLAGRTILVFAEQGIGDTIQFARFLIDLHARGATVKALVQRALMRLVGSLPAPVAWFDLVNAVGRFDYQIPLLSLPHVLRTRLDTIPKDVPYLFADPASVAAWRQRIGGDGFRIGIVWQGNPQYRNDRNRSVPLHFYAPLAAIAGVRLISLQAVHGLDQLRHLPEGMTVEELGETITANPDGISEIAAAMANLDLIVSSDTAMAHLAGALARPVWLALGDDADWRWLLERSDSPWYPTMRLFRQAVRGDWAGVFAAMAEALKERVGR